MDIVIRNQNPVRTAAIRHRGPYQEIGKAFGELDAWVKANHIMERFGGSQPAQKGIAVYYDNPRVTPVQELRSDACAVLPEGFEVTGESVRELTVAGGTYAMCLYVGPYSGIGGAWEQMLGQWLPGSGRAFDMTRDCAEFYLDVCGDVPDEKLRTEILVPILA